MAEQIEEKPMDNVISEAFLVGAMYKKPDLFVSWGISMRPDYDFSDEGAKFYYQNFALMYTTFSQTFDESKVNAFMYQDNERFQTYKRYKGYKTIQEWMQNCDADDFDKYYNTVKKYSLIREYHRNGFNVQKLMNSKKFDLMLPKDVSRIIRAKADKIHTVVMANEEHVYLDDSSVKEIQSYLIKPQMGINYPWENINSMFHGCRMGKVVMNGFLSNEGKSRNMVMLFAYLSLVKGEKVMMLSNEMAEEDLKSALITTVINNKCFKDIHKIDIEKKEEELVLGQYRDAEGKFIERKVDEETNVFLETESEYTARVYRDSEEFRKVLEVGRWIEERKDKLFFFKDVGTDYSDEMLEFEIRKYNIVYGIKYFGYDTMKGFRTDDWATLKQTATRLKELMKEINCWGWLVFQLSDDTVFTNIFELSSNNIANAKQIKHVADYMLLGKKINEEEYPKYQYVSNSTWGTMTPQYLDHNKRYFAMRVEKNRGGSKDYTPLFEYDLNLNTWKNIGSLQKRG